MTFVLDASRRRSGSEKRAGGAVSGHHLIMTTDLRSVDLQLGVGANRRSDSEDERETKLHGYGWISEGCGATTTG